jgi:nicotinate-nucleotide pyrophosphorylase (carboxylating)
LSLEGNARDLLTCERLVLNLLSRMCGVATLTARYVAELRGTGVRLYDTRKTTPGWRRLEKYSVRMGGGHNHRTGLYDGFLIKDNHLALGHLSPGEAVVMAKQWAGGDTDLAGVPEMVEVEVDSLSQLIEVLPLSPDIVLLDNFQPVDLRRAVELRNEIAPGVELEASGNVKLDTLRQIAATGVERISSGALTHQAVWLDLGMDYAA